MRLFVVILLLACPRVFGALDFTAASSHGIVSGLSSLTNQTGTLHIRSYGDSYTTRGLFGVYETSGNSYIYFQYATSSRFQFVASADGGGTTTTVTKDNTYLNRWVSIAFVMESATMRRCYLDGVEEATSSVSRSLGILDKFVVISARLDTGSVANYGRGLLSDAAIWNVALTAAEIASLATNASPSDIRPQNLVFYAPLDNLGPGGGSGTTVNLVGPPVMLTNAVSQATTQPRIYK